MIVGKKRIRGYLYVIVIFMIQFTILDLKNNNICLAKEKNDEGCDVVFVLDVSGSMLETDKNRVSIEIIKMMTDLLSNGDSLVGFIAYNDTIAYSHKLIQVKDNRSRKKIKNYINKVIFSGETDIGLGLLKAVDMQCKSNSSNKNKIVCLLSDGKTDLAKSHTGRTENDSWQDVENSIKLATENNITIYTIGLNNNFNENVDYLQTISKQTGGESFVASSPFQLIEIINGIIDHFQMYKMENYERVISNGKLTEKTLILGNENLEKCNIVLFSSSDIKEIKVFGIDDNKIKIFKSQLYSIIEIDRPPSKIDICYKSKKGSSVSIDYQSFYDISGKIEVNSDYLIKKEYNIPFQFINNVSNEKIQNEELLEQTKIEAYLYHENGDRAESLLWKIEENEVKIISQVENPGVYYIELQYITPLGIGTARSRTFRAEVLIPTVIDTIDVSICEGKTKEFDLSELFETKIDTGLEYTIEKIENGNTCAKIENRKLILSGNEVGKCSLNVIANGMERVYKIEFKIKVQTIWETYQVIIVAAIITTIIIGVISLNLIIHLKNRKRIKSAMKKHFTGSIYGHFIDLKSAHDIPKLYWKLAEYPGVGVTLNKLLLDAGVNDYFMGADRIWFYPTDFGAIQIVHNLSGSIFLEEHLLPQNVPTIIEPGKKIYVCFEENGVEIELIYAATTKNMR